MDNELSTMNFIYQQFKHFNKHAAYHQNVSGRHQRRAIDINRGAVWYLLFETALFCCFFSTNIMTDLRFCRLSCKPACICPLKIIRRIISLAVVAGKEFARLLNSVAIWAITGRFVLSPFAAAAYNRLSPVHLPLRNFFMVDRNIFPKHQACA